MYTLSLYLETLSAIRFEEGLNIFLHFRVSWKFLPIFYYNWIESYFYFVSIFSHEVKFSLLIFYNFRVTIYELETLWMFNADLTQLFKNIDIWYLNFSWSKLMLSIMFLITQHHAFNSMKNSFLGSDTILSSWVES